MVVDKAFAFVRSKRSIVRCTLLVPRHAHPSEINVRYSETPSAHCSVKDETSLLPIFRKS